MPQPETIGYTIMGGIISGTMFLSLLILGIFLISGRGAMLIAGYNTMPEKERAKYDENALCRFSGWLVISIDACMALIAASAFLRLAWLGICGGAATAVLIIAAVIYANTGGRFKKEE